GPGRKAPAPGAERRKFVASMDLQGVPVRHTGRLDGVARRSRRQSARDERHPAGTNGMIFGRERASHAVTRCYALEMKVRRLQIPLILLSIAVAVALIEAAGIVSRTALAGRHFSWPIALRSGF